MYIFWWIVGLSAITSFIKFTCHYDYVSSQQSKQSISLLFGGKHELKRFNILDSKGTYLHGSFFLGTGSIDGGTYETQKVSFCWKDHNGQYVVSKIDPSKIKVEIDSSLQTPYITFEGDFYPGESNVDTVDVNDSFREYMNIIIVHCNEKDFQTDININSLK